MIAAIKAVAMVVKIAIPPPRLIKIVTVIAAVVVAWAYFSYIFMPVFGNSIHLFVARNTAKHGDFEITYESLDGTAARDNFSPTALSLKGKISLSHFYATGQKDKIILLQAADSFTEAAKRNKSDFKNFKNLSEVYSLLADKSIGRKKSEFAVLAYGNALNAAQLYPGSAKLRIEWATLAEKSGKTSVAIEQYKEAIEIEDAYRKQFKKMYPDRNIFSRLGEEKYQFAQDRIKQLEK